jgi:AraC-like DNA-binding protein
MAALHVGRDFHSDSSETFNQMKMATYRIEQHVIQRQAHYRDPLQHVLVDPNVPSPDTMQHRLQIFLSKHLRERVTLKDLSTFLGYSQKYCSEFFRLQMGVSFSHYVQNLRITKATGMLMDHDLPLSHIAELLGFSDSFAFSHFFKRAVGCSPSEFRKHHIIQLGS